MNLKSNEGMQVFFDELAQLQKVKQTFMHKYNPEEFWPTFRMQKGNDVFKFVLSQDPEGNGGGFAFIEDL